MNITEYSHVYYLHTWLIYYFCPRVCMYAYSHGRSDYGATLHYLSGSTYYLRLTSKISGIKNIF